MADTAAVGGRDTATATETGGVGTGERELARERERVEDAERQEWWRREARGWGPSCPWPGVSVMALCFPVSAHVVARVKDTCAEVTVEQIWQNQSDSAVEAIYSFPFYNDMAIFNVEVEIDNKCIATELREKEHAINKYDDSIASGHGAYLIEVTESNLIRVCLGNLPARAQAKLIIQYVTELLDNGMDLVLSIPNHVCPSPASFSIDVHVDSCFPVTNILALSHQALEHSSSSSEFHFELKSLGIKHFECIILHEQANKCYGRIEQSENGAPAALVTFVPTWQHLDPDATQLACDVIFVVDRSGSMTSSIRTVGKTMELFLRSLPFKSKFNIVGFGSSYEKLFPKSVSYSRETLEVAIAHVNSMEADLEWTELLPPLQHIFEEEFDEEYHRQVFVLTDGDVSHRNQVIALAQQHSHRIQVFTIGIGETVDLNLVRSLAEAGNGTVEYVKLLGSPIELRQKVIRQLKQALEPPLRQITIKWPGVAQQTPQRIRPAFCGRRLTIYALLEGCNLPPSGEVPILLQGIGPDGNVHEYAIACEIGGSSKNLSIHRLAASHLIKELGAGSRDDPKLKPILTEISLKWNVLCPYTAFVAVEKRTIVSSAMEKVEVYTDTSSQIAARVERQRREMIAKTAALQASLPLKHQELEVAAQEWEEHKERSSRLGMQLHQVEAEMVQLEKERHCLETGLQNEKAALQHFNSQEPTEEVKHKTELLNQTIEAMQDQLDSVREHCNAVRHSALLVDKEEWCLSQLCEKEEEAIREKQQEIHSLHAKISEQQERISVLEDTFLTEKATITIPIPPTGISNDLHQPSSSTSTTPTPATAINPPSKSDLDSILSLQEAHGWWDEASVSAVLSLGIQVIQSHTPAELVTITPEPLRAQVWASAIMLGLLESCHKERQDEWVLIAAKAKRAIASVLKPLLLSLPLLLGAAQKFVEERK
ncbi:von willebrand factor a [Pelomyxa schiedti]|nr:von willebrand factor a [Pelomyxa schiedti]